MRSSISRGQAAIIALAAGAAGLLAGRGPSVCPRADALGTMFPGARGVVNVQDQGAKGDGTTDDTAAFQTSLDAVGNAGGGIVFAPTGNYLIGGHLTIPAHTALVGVFRGPQAYSQNKGTTLLAVEGAGNSGGDAFITLTGPNSTVEKLTVFHPNQTITNPPVAYPWTIQGGGGDNATIRDVLLVNPYLGVDLATNASGRHLVEGLYGQPLLIGIQVDQCYDIGRIKNVHFWPFWTVAQYPTAVDQFTGANGFSFVFKRTDWEVVEDIFSFGYHVGALFSSSGAGSMNGQMTDVNFDNVDVGLDCYDTQGPAVHISNLNVANAGNGATKVGILGHAGHTAQIDVRGASFWGSMNQALNWQNGGLVSISDARVLSWNPNSAAFEVLGGRAMLHDNFFQDVIGTAIHVGPGADRVMVSGNQLTGNSIKLEPPLAIASNNQP